jgi:hypothetical protein
VFVRPVLPFLHLPCSFYAFAHSYAIILFPVQYPIFQLGLRRADRSEKEPKTCTFVAYKEASVLLRVTVRRTVPVFFVDHWGLLLACVSSPLSRTTIFPALIFLVVWVNIIEGKWTANYTSKYTGTNWTWTYRMDLRDCYERLLRRTSGRYVDG